ncbi:MAG: DUF502 domain-containing protein [Calditrichaeota bacterium]|nr:DUF502 domain-containing protein [Calditrichota bacterium]MCB0305943.1 DUF502 domain-containing protein [Calditrichota bacterium]MCB0314513.1 DUF502 domain-containing protein [Calditrichota bacterium]
MKTMFEHLKRYVFRGILATIPLVLTYLVLRILYVGVDQQVTGMVDDMTGVSIPGLGLILVIILLYLIGVVGSNVVGRKIFSIIERVTRRIPLIGTTYQIGKQLSSTFALPERQVFKRAVLVEYLTPGMWTVGFVTGSLIDGQNQDEKLLKVYIPTPPNPTSGTLVLVRESQTRNPGWTIEEAMKAVISAGIIGPIKISASQAGGMEVNLLSSKK